MTGGTGLVEVDCTRYRDRCRELQQAAVEGLSVERLRQLGIEPGSDRARKLEQAIWDIFLRCCAQRIGPLPPPLAEPLPEPPPPRPGTPAPQPPGDGVGSVVAAGTALAIPAERATLAELLAWLRSLGARIHPLTLLVLIAAMGGAAAATQRCDFENKRWNSEVGAWECLYVCPDGRTYYTYDVFGLGCLPFITRGV